MLFFDISFHQGSPFDDFFRMLIRLPISFWSDVSKYIRIEGSLNNLWPEIFEYTSIIFGHKNSICSLLLDLGTWLSLRRWFSVSTVPWSVMMSSLCFSLMNIHKKPLLVITFLTLGKTVQIFGILGDLTVGKLVCPSLSSKQARKLVHWPWLSLILV